MTINKVLASIIFCVFGVVSVSACSQPATETVRDVDHQSLEDDLEQTMLKFNELFESNLIGETVDFLPPRIVEKLINETGSNELELKVGMQALWDDVLKTVTIENVAFDTRSLPIESTNAGDKYKRIPTSVVMSMKDNPDLLIDAQSETIAILLDASWYIVRLDDQTQIDRFFAAYPEYESITLKDAEMNFRQREN